MRKSKGWARRPSALLGAPTLDRSGQPLGGSVEVMPNPPPGFLIASCGHFCSDNESSGSWSRVLAGGLEKKLSLVVGPVGREGIGGTYSWSSVSVTRLCTRLWGLGTGAAVIPVVALLSCGSAALLAPPLELAS